MGRLKGTVGWVLAAALLCLMTSPASAAIALVQQKTNSANAAASIIVTLTTNPTTTVGNLLVLVGETNCFSLATPTGSGVTTWQRATFSTTNANIEIWYGVVSTASSTGVTVQSSNACSGAIRAHLMEFSGLYANQATVFDKANAISGTTSPAPATSWAGITTTNANDLLVFGIADTASNTFGTPTGGGWTNLTTVTTSTVKTSDWYRVVSSATTYKPTVTDTGTVAWDAALASFKACPAVADVSYVTANAQNGQATVYWPSATSVVVLRKQGAAFTNEKPGDNLTYTTNTDPLGTVGAAHVSYVGSGPMPADTGLLNTGTSYYYKVFKNNGSQCYSPGVSVNVAPNASVPKWTYDTTATSMAPPGLAPNDVVIAGSGDWNIHALEASNTLNGIRAFAPVLTLNVIQSRPAVIPSDLGPGLYSAYDAQTGLAYWKFEIGRAHV